MLFKANPSDTFDVGVVQAVLDIHVNLEWPASVLAGRFVLGKLLLCKTSSHRRATAVIASWIATPATLAPLAHLPRGGLRRCIRTDGPHPQRTTQVCGQFGVQTFDLGQGITHSRADGLPRPLRLVAEPSVPAA